MHCVNDIDKYFFFYFLILCVIIRIFSRHVQPRVQAFIYCIFVCSIEHLGICIYLLFINPYREKVLEPHPLFLKHFGASRALCQNRDIKMPQIQVLQIVSQYEAFIEAPQRFIMRHFFQRRSYVSLGGTEVSRF